MLTTTIESIKSQLKNKGTGNVSFRAERQLIGTQLYNPQELEQSADRFIKTLNRHLFIDHNQPGEGWDARYTDWATATLSGGIVQIGYAE